MGEPFPRSCATRETSDRREAAGSLLSEPPRVPAGAWTDSSPRGEQRHVAPARDTARSDGGGGTTTTTTTTTARQRGRWRRQRPDHPRVPMSPTGTLRGRHSCPRDARRLTEDARAGAARVCCSNDEESSVRSSFLTAAAQTPLRVDWRPNLIVPKTVPSPTRTTRETKARKQNPASFRILSNRACSRQRVSLSAASNARAGCITEYYGADFC